MESLLSKAARFGVNLMLVKQAVSMASQSQAPAPRRLRATQGSGHPSPEMLPGFGTGELERARREHARPLHFAYGNTRKCMNTDKKLKFQ